MNTGKQRWLVYSVSGGYWYEYVGGDVPDGAIDWYYQSVTEIRRDWRLDEMPPDDLLVWLGGGVEWRG